MKKFMLVAAVSAAAVLTACGDDSSSNASNAPGCTVSVVGNSVVMTETFPMIGSYTTTYTVEGDSVTTTYSAHPQENEVEPLYGRTLDYYKKQAEEDCEDFSAQ